MIVKWQPWVKMQFSVVFYSANGTPSETAKENRETGGGSDEEEEKKAATI